MAIAVRLRHDPRTRACAERRTKGGLSKMEITRYLKRYLARDVYRTRRADLEDLNGA
jgi:transposase